MNLQAAPNATVNMGNSNMVNMSNAMSMAPNNGTAQQNNPLQQGKRRKIYFQKNISPLMSRV